MKNLNCRATSISLEVGYQKDNFLQRSHLPCFQNWETKRSKESPGRQKKDA